MYNVDVVNRLMTEKKKNGSDLAEYCFGDRRHTVRHLIREGANPTAELIEKVADFLEVSTDELFGRYNPRSAEDDCIELMKKLIRSQENQLQMRADENGLLKDKIRLLEFELQETKKNLKK